MKLETQFVKANSADAMKFQHSNSPDALRINITEEDAMKKYSLDYGKLSSILKNKYSDFKLDRNYHSLRKQLEKDIRYARTKLLDPNNPKSLKKTFYCPEIVKEFDKHYTKK